MCSVWSVCIFYLYFQKAFDESFPCQKSFKFKDSFDNEEDAFQD